MSHGCIGFPSHFTLLSSLYGACMAIGAAPNSVQRKLRHEEGVGDSAPDRWTKYPGWQGCTGLVREGWLAENLRMGPSKKMAKNEHKWFGNIGMLLPIKCIQSYLGAILLQPNPKQNERGEIIKWDNKVGEKKNEHINPGQTMKQEDQLSYSTS